MILSPGDARITSKPAREVHDCYYCTGDDNANAPIWPALRLDMYDFVGWTGANLNVTAKIAAPSKARRGKFASGFQRSFAMPVQYYPRQENRR